MVPFCIWNRGSNRGGRGGIRTHGGLPHARFRVECLKPDSATLPLNLPENVERSELATGRVRPTGGPDWRSTSNIQCRMQPVGNSMFGVGFKAFPFFDESLS